MKDAQNPKSDTQGVVHFGERVLHPEEFLQVGQSLPLLTQPQKSYQEDFVVASTEKVMTAFLESEPQYENLYRRLADI